MRKIFTTFLVKVLLTKVLLAGGTPSQQWVVQQTNTRAQGDYVSATSGGGQYITTNKYYAYFIEVTSATTRLVIDIFDPNIYEVTTGDFGENRNGTAWDTQTNYTLLDPSGSVVATLTGTNSPLNNQQWVNLADVTSPQNGHWELRVQVASGDDVNIYGVRAHDGDPGAGGNELNVYAESYLSLGHTGTGLPNPKVHVFYPYVIRGCGFRSMDFDNDSNNLSSLQFSSPDGSYNPSFSYTSLSGPAAAAGTGNDGWAFNFVTYSNFALLYGLWTETFTVGGNNQLVCLVTDDDHSASAPTQQQEPGSFRLYLPTDAGTKPAKPQVTQNVTHVSGPNPPSLGIPTFYNLTFTIQNQTSSPISFSAPSNIFSSFVPGTLPNANVTYQGSLSTTHGSVISTPMIGGSGSVLWNPGVIPPSTNASITYRVSVLPTSCPSQINLTGTGTNATTIRFVDETANTSQTRATLTIGGLCVLQTAECLGPTAAFVTVQGRVVRPDGRGIPRAIVQMTDGQGNVRTSMTNSFGYYRFLEVMAGDIYSFSVTSKGYSFTPVSLYISDETVLDFTSEIGSRKNFD